MDDVADPSRVPDDENTLEGSVTEEDPPENMFGDDDDEEEIVGTTDHEPAPEKSDDPIEENVEENQEDVVEPTHEESEHEGGDEVQAADFQSHEQVTWFSLKTLFL